MELRMDSANSPAPTWGASLAWAEAALARAGSPSPQLDALVLLMHAAHASQTLLLSEPGHPMAPPEVERYAGWVARRAEGEPVAYITGHKAFMGLDLLVDRRVLLVRPSTHWLVEAALESVRNRPAAVDDGGLLAADIGTGCGAMALALGALEPRISHIYAVDVSADALAVARGNGARYVLNVLISWLEGDTLAPVPEPVDLIVANLPYLRDVPDGAAPKVLRYEPHMALFSGPDGLNHIRKLIVQAPAKLRPGGTLILAHDDTQRLAVAKLLAAALPRAHVSFGPRTVGGAHFAIAQLPQSPNIEEEHT
jgi:release factor glutamine methyltransferase